MLEGVLGACLGLGVTQQATSVVVRHHDALQLESELFSVEVAPQLTLFDCDASGFREQGGQAGLCREQVVALRSGGVVELGRCGNENAAARLSGISDPGEPTLEELAQACDA